MSYRIRPGDTLSSIARRLGTTVAALAKANGIWNVNRISAGRILRTPGDSFTPAAPKKSSQPKQVSAPGGSGSGTTMQRLAAAARKAALAINRPGLCARGVQDALAAMGYGDIPRVGSAYQKAAQLARDPRFKEIRANSVGSLPTGAIVVWNKTGANSAVGKHGHIAVMLDGGMEAASVVRRRLDIGSQMRVFVPVSCRR